MPEQITKNFGGGLDSRSFFLNSPINSLQQVVNLHVTAGGELEKRKLFLPYALPPSFGFQETTQGIVVFGSYSLTFTTSDYTVQTFSGITQVELTLPAGVMAGWDGFQIVVTGSAVAGVNGTQTVTFSNTGEIDYVVPMSVDGTYSDTLTVTFLIPSPFIYQQLIYPIAGVTLTGIKSSTYFNGEPQTIAIWSNGDVTVYDGSAIETDFYVGSQSLITPTPFAIANSLVDQAIASGHYTGIKPVLSALYFQITGGTNSAGVNQVVTVGYNFNRQVTLSDGAGGTATDSQFFVLSPAIDWATSNSATATAVVNSINANAGGANPWGFVAAIGISSNIVTLTPPALDGNGATLGLNAADTIIATPSGNVTLFIPPDVATFDILSIPDQSSPNPFTVATTVIDAGLTFKLVSNGVAATLPAGAAGQFTITAGIPNAKGTGTLTISGSGPANNDTVTIGGVIYTAVSALGRPANQFLIGGSIDATLGNLIAALNGSTGAGSKYSSATSASNLVSAGALIAHATVITAIPNGTPGNIVVSSSSANLVWSGLTAGHLTGGTDTNQITQITVGGVSLLASVVPYNTSANQTANDTVASINAFSGTSGFTATANLNVITVLSVGGGTSVNNAVLSVQCTGGVCIAYCFFLVAIQTGTKNITAITTNNGAGTNIMSSTVTFSTTVAAFCAAVAANINANQSTAHYAAASIGNQIFISAATVTSSDVDPLLLVANGAGIIISQGATTAIAATGNTSIVPFTVTANSAVSVNAPNSAVVTAIGGSPPYTYSWERSGPQASPSSSPAYGFSAASPTTANQWWSITNPNRSQKPSGSETWICTVKDAFGATATVNFTLFV